MADTYYVERGRRPLNCWDCDGIRGCKCSKLRIRNVKRGARQVWRARMHAEAVAADGARKL